MKISNFLAHHALNELMLMGYTVVKGRLVPPEQLSKDACEYFGVVLLPPSNTSIEVKPIAAEEEKVNPYSLREADDFRIDTLENKVRVTHKATLVFSECGDNISQHANKVAAFASLHTMLDDLQRNWKSED